jgi:hypothetical protein
VPEEAPGRSVPPSIVASIAVASVLLAAASDRVHAHQGAAAAGASAGLVCPIAPPAAPAGKAPPLRRAAPRA